MAYEVMVPKSNGDPVSARDWNRIVGNFAAGVPDLMTTKGDLVAATGADAAARVPVGANGAYLFADSEVTAGLTYSPRPLVHASNTSAQSDWVSSNQWIKQYDQLSGLYDTTSSYIDNQYSIPVSGKYLIVGQHFFRHTTNNAFWSVKTGLFKNGALECVLFSSGLTGDASTSRILAQGATILDFKLGDKLDLYYYVTQTAGFVYLEYGGTKLLAFLL